jgi:hypothetical protein
VTTPERRCSLPGCDALIEQADDVHKQRKYCCDEHRAAARRIRQVVAAESVAAESVAAESVAAESVAAESVAAESVAAESVAAESVAADEPADRGPVTSGAPELIGAAPRTGFAAIRGGRTSTAAVLLAGILIVLVASGGGLGSFQRAAQHDTAAPPGLDAWRARAQAALLSIRAQLAEINPAQIAWRSVPAEKQVGELAGPSVELAKREAQLVQDEGRLQRALDEAAQFTAAAESLTDVSRQSAALASDVATGNVAVVWQSSALSRLSTLEDRADALRRDLADRQPAVVAAMAAELPPADDATIGLVGEVIRAAQQASTPTRPNPGAGVSPAPAPARRTAAAQHRAAVRPHWRLDPGALTGDIIDTVLTGVGIG